jgi:hypothetical protein
MKDFKMSKEINFPKYKTFFYGACTEDKLTQMIADSEEEGCQLVQVMAGMMLPPQSPLAIPMAKPQPIQVMRILVRAREETYNALIAKANKSLRAD